MLTLEDVTQLEAFDGGAARVLSAYLRLDPARQVRRSHRVVFDDLVKEARARLSEPTGADLAREPRFSRWGLSLEQRGHDRPPGGRTKRCTGHVGAVEQRVQMAKRRR